MDHDRTQVAPEVVDSGAAASASSGAPSPSADAAARASGEGNGTPADEPVAPSSTAPGPCGPDSVPAAEAEPVEGEGTGDDELAARAARADEYLALAQRTKADFENYRKRAVREAAAAQERGATKLALALLPAIDNLERALAHAAADVGVSGDEDAGEGVAGEGTAVEGAAGGARDDSLAAGIRHIHADLIAALGRAGIERYCSVGERFDPAYHEAVAQQPVPGTDPGVIVEVYQSGYRIGSNVVRPARVVVAG